MINLIALWIVVSSVGAALVMSPGNLAGTASPEYHSPLEVAKESTRESLQYASDTARKTGEGIKRTVASAVNFPGHAAEVVQRRVGEVAQSVKHGSQVGLEKIGLATPSEPAPASSFERWENELQASKEKAAALKAATVDSALNTRAGIQESYNKYFGKEEEPPAPYFNTVKDKVVNAFDATKDTTGDASSAVKDTVLGTGKTIREGVQGTFNSAEDAAFAAKDGVFNAAELARKKASENIEFVDDLALRIAQSIQDYITDKGEKASGTAGSAYEHAAEGLKGVDTKAKTMAGVNRSPTYQEMIKQATERAADILKNKAKEAALYMPNVGQGLSYASPNSGENTSAVGPLRTGGELGSYYYKSAEPKIIRSAQSSDDWREHFLDKVGIKSEADLAKKDVLIGNFESIYSGGVFHRADEALASTSIVAGDAEKPVEEKVAELIHDAGGEPTKEAVEEVMHDAQTSLDPPVRTDLEQEVQNAFETELSVKAQQNDEEITVFKSKTANSVANLWRTVSRASAAWIESSCRAVHLFAFATTYGTSFWVTFVSGYILSRTIPRNQFAIVQSRVFPIYLNVIASGQAVCVVFYTFLHPWAEAGSDEKYQYLDLWAVLLATLTNLFFLEPRATKAMFEKIRIEKEEGKGQDDIVGVEDHAMKLRLARINNNFRAFHGYSSFANLLSLVGMTWHLCHLSAR